LGEVEDVPHVVVFATPYLASIISTASSTTCDIDASSGDQFMSSIRGQKTELEIIPRNWVAASSVSSSLAVPRAFSVSS